MLGDDEDFVLEDKILDSSTEELDSNKESVLNVSVATKGIKTELVVDSLGDKTRFATVSLAPLNRGWGVTLGNAMRRVLLSYIPGAAITSAHIKGVDQEFSSIRGVVEDVTEILLNLKSVSISTVTPGEFKANIRVSGPVDVTAGMISLPSGLEIFNKDHHICTLQKGAAIEIALIIETGCGYVSASHNKKSNSIYSSASDVVGFIPMAACFSPIKRVTYKVEETRMGGVVSYDKLILDLETDGSIKPEVACSTAAKIICDQLLPLTALCNFPDEGTKIAEKKQKLSFRSILLRSIGEMDLSVRSQNCLKNVNICYLGQLVTKTEAEMLKTPNFGKKSLSEIAGLLATESLSLGMEVKGWPDSQEKIEELISEQEQNSF